MELEHTFTVPVTADEAFTILRDIRRIGPCMPGATIESVDGDTFTGSVKIKVGPIQVAYRGEAAYTEVDEAARTAVIEAKGKETRGAGTANATIRARLEEQGDATQVHVVTDLAITGRPAQFGRGVMVDVGDKLLGQFADCLARELSGTNQPDEASAAEDGEPSHATPAASAPREAEAIDLLDVAGAPVAKRLAPVLGGLVLLLLVWRWRRRRRRRRQG